MDRTEASVENVPLVVAFESTGAALLSTVGSTERTVVTASAMVAAAGTNMEIDAVVEETSPAETSLTGEVSAGLRVANLRTVIREVLAANATKGALHCLLEGSRQLEGRRNRRLTTRVALAKW